jgi:hypothetical protein
MLRMATIAVLLLMETTVFAQQLDASKGIKLGVGASVPSTNLPLVYGRARSTAQMREFGAQMGKYSIG